MTNTATITGGGSPVTPAQVSLLANGSSFTVFGIIAAGAILWVSSQNATGESRSLINLFLFTLLASMILLNWGTVSSIFFKGATTG